MNIVTKMNRTSTNTDRHKGTQKGEHQRINFRRDKTKYYNNYRKM